MTSKDAVVVNTKGLFYDGYRHWGTTDTQFWVGTRSNAIRLARKLKEASREDVYVVTGYGTTEEKWELVTPELWLQEVERPF